jgi:hypothetical protein
LTCYYRFIRHSDILERLFPVMRKAIKKILEAMEKISELFGPPPQPDLVPIPVPVREQYPRRR